MAAEFLTNPYLWHVVSFTFLQAVLSTLLTLIVALPLARSLTHYHFFGKTFLLRFMQFTWMIPSLAVVLGLITVFGRNGWISNLFHFVGLEYNFSFYGLGAILFAHIFLNIPLATRFIFNDLARVPEEAWRLGSQLSFSAWNSFCLIEWPQIKNTFFGIGCLVFLLCFASFTIVLALGGGPRYSTIEVAIYHAIKFDYNLNQAFILSLFQIIPGFFIAFFSFSLIKKSLSFSTIGMRKYSSANKMRPWDFLVFVFAFILLVPPIIAIIVSGLNDQFFTVVSSGSLWLSAFYSILIALLSGLLSTLLGLFIGWINLEKSSFPKTLTLINLIIPPTILSTIIFILFRPIIDQTLFCILAVVFINCLMSLPFTLRIVTNPIQETFEKYNRLTANLGFTSWEKWRLISFPLLRKTLANALAISTILSLGDFSVIAFFGSPALQTLPFYTYNLLASYQLPEASVAVLILILLSIVILIFIEKIVGGKNANS